MIPYFRNRLLARAEFLLFSLYLGHSPYKLSNKKESLTYGETYPFAISALGKALQLASHDLLIDVGCGRGRSSFAFYTLFGCNVIGLDLVKEFIDRGNYIQRELGLEGLSFQCLDILEYDYSKATALFIAATCFDEAMMQKLVECFKKLPFGAKIATVSDAFSSYSDEFILDKTLEVSFLWGKSTLYIEHKRSHLDF